MGCPNSLTFIFFNGQKGPGRGGRISPFAFFALLTPRQMNYQVSKAKQPLDPFF